ncbi:MAG: TetR/AcrR family transcriptional regulator [Ghiorsea sp.]
MDRSLDSKSRIIDTASALFHKHGFESVGMQKICTQAKVSKSSFYHFFTSKDELAIAVLEAHWQQGKSSIQELMVSPLSPLAKIQFIFEHSLTDETMFCSESGDFMGCPFGNLASELSASNPVLREKVQQVFESFTEIFCQLIEQAQAQSELSHQMDSQATARALMTFMQGLSVLGKVHNDSNQLQQDAAFALHLMLGIPLH